MPGRPARAAVAILIAGVATVIVLWRRPEQTGYVSDFGQVWYSAKVLPQGGDPYSLIGPGRQFALEFPFNYPLTASVAVLPLGLLNQIPATAVFIGLSSALLAFGITASGWQRLPLFLSVPFVYAVRSGQWSPIMSAAFCLPALAWITAAKPSIGFAILLAKLERRFFVNAAIGGTLLAIIAVGFVPRWPLEWFESLRHATYVSAPVLRPFGFIALIALLRWRRPEARLVAALACIPQTPLWYEVLPLLLVASTFRESLILSLLSSLPIAYEVVFGRRDGVLDLYPMGAQMAFFAYLPAVVLVLARNNEGPHSKKGELKKVIPGQ